ncbi:MAG TPA: penicillin-binding protein 2 [Candidatus Limnocylindrales bacterium]|nr:penicillin-binding protein 2 [Candidatus Limnocylindrales bacterium]
MSAAAGRLRTPALGADRGDAGGRRHRGGRGGGQARGRRGAEEPATTTAAVGLDRLQHGRRLPILGILFGLLALSLVVRLGYWQIVQRDDLVADAQRQLGTATQVPTKRGDIYDRTGAVLLAGTATRERLVGSGQQLTPDQVESLVEILTPILDLDDTGQTDLRAKLVSGKAYVVLAQDLSPSVAEQIRAATDAAGIPGLSFESTYTRSYQPGGAPGTSLAAQLVGFVNQAGQGQYGVEQAYQSVLAGQPRLVESNGSSGAPDTQLTVNQGAPGSDLQLTIDAGLQAEVEQEVMAAKIADRADNVSVVVMDPRNGAIYADATYPSYDANAYQATANDDPSLFLDPTVSTVYEPGSVFKLFTTIAALEQGTATLTTKFNDSGHLSLDGGKARIQDADGKAMGVLKLQDAIAFSRNVVAAKVALGLSGNLQTSSEILHSVWTRFGFGKPTGIDVADEVGGLVNDPAITPWRQIDLANGSFGQGVAVTEMQLATAYAAIVNGGILVQPHVVQSIAGQPVQVANRGQVMDPALTPELQGLLNHVLSTSWYRNDVIMKGHYWLGGKTGTAQIWDAKRHQWSATAYNFSFIGYIGRRPGQPDLIIAVKIGAAHPLILGQGDLILSIKSTELFRRIATDAVTTAGLLPPLPPQPAASPSASPNDPLKGTSTTSAGAGSSSTAGPLPAAPAALPPDDRGGG